MIHTGSTPSLNTKDQTAAASLSNDFRLQPNSLTRAPTRLVSTRSFAETPRNPTSSTQMPTQIRTVANKHLQDVIDVIPFYRSTDSSGKNEIRVLCHEVARPALLARSILGAPPHPVNASGVIVNLPGRFIVGSANESIQSVLKDRLGVSAISEPIILGGASVVLPNSPEIAFTRAVEILPPSKDEFVLPGEAFGPRRITSFSLQEIVDRSLSRVAPSLFDIRLLEAALSLAEALGEPVTLPQLGSEHARVYSQDLTTPILTSKDVQKLLRDKRPAFPIVTELGLKEVPTPDDPFLKEYQLQGDIFEPGSNSRTSFSADVIARDNVDSVAVAGWCNIRDSQGNVEPYLLVNMGARCALSARVRETVAHPLSFRTNERHLEITNSSVDTARTPAELRALVPEIVKRETGLSAHPDTITLALQGFRSPGFSPDCDHVFLVEVDPTSRPSSHISPSGSFSFLIRAAELRDLRHTGGSPDLLCNLAAALVERFGSRPPPPSRKYELALERALLQRLHDESPNILTFAAEHMPELLTVPSTRALLRRMTEELGQSFRLVKRPDEAAFFSPLSPDNPLATQSTRTARDFVHALLLAAHDATHFRLGEFLPYVVTEKGMIVRGQDGAPRMQPQGVNREVLMTNEAFALYGDSQLARAIGIERYEHLSGSVSIARIFSDLRADRPYSPTQELAAIYSMVVKGIIPDEIMSHPHYPVWRPIILSTLLGYYVRDLDNCDLMYKFWQEHPEVGQAALDLCPNASASSSIFGERFSRMFPDLRDSRAQPETNASPSEGFNPFKAAVLRLRRSEIPRVGLALALVSSYIRKNSEQAGTSPHQSEALEAIAYSLKSLRKMAERLDHVATGIVNGDPSPYNLHAAQVYLEETEGTFERASQLLAELRSDTRLLSESQLAERVDKEYYLVEQPRFSTDDLRAKVEAREAWNFAQQTPPRH